jgi:hypothetical protein
MNNATESVAKIAMMDLFYIGTAVAFFAASAWYLRGCANL